jgi:hypothetical protein
MKAVANDCTGVHRDWGVALAATSPPPLWGRDRVGGIAEHPMSGVPPPLTPPHKGEGNPVAVATCGAPNVDGSMTP